MNPNSTRIVCALLISITASVLTHAAEPIAPPKAFIDGTGPDWKTFGESDFVNVNCARDTWTWKEDVAHCTGQPVGVIRTQEPFKNFELVAQWRHLRPAGNSGIFVWANDEALRDLKPGVLPKGGIEIQVLDLAFADKFEKENGQKGDWFTTHGDVFPVGTAKMTPFKPTSPNGSRSFPRKDLTKASDEWNHYYVRCINGEVRLWVNGEEVSGGSDSDPTAGYICLESEGSPVEFKNLRVRKLP
jgi:Domain of Unknown Function (DUF1080)